MDVLDDTEGLSKRLLASQAHLLQLIESRDPLPEVLESLTHYVESLSPGIRCSILLADPTGVLVHGAAPSLPVAYSRAIDRLPIRDGIGSCGTAAARREMVIVDDISASPLWRGYAELARTHDIAACWSTPIIASSGELLGTCGMYYAECRAPNRTEIEHVQFIGSLAAIVIQRQRELEQLATDEARYRELTETSPDAVLAHRNGTLLYCNHAAAQLFGFDQRSLSFATLGSVLRAADDLQNHRRGVREGRLRCADDSWVDLEIAAAEMMINGEAATLWVCRDVTQRVNLEKAILDAASREQERLGYELHDGLGQQLTGISLLLRTLQSRVTDAMPDTAPAFEDLASLLGQSIEDARRLALGLSPMAVEQSGLAGALSGLGALIKDIHEIECCVNIEPAPPISLAPTIATHLYRIAQEAVQNAVRHAQAHALVITLSRAGSSLVMTIDDDGVGMPRIHRTNTGLGLRSMDYRARRVGAKLGIESLRPQGTRIRVSLPI